MSTPSVSVIIPAYNTAIFIAETLDSVFAQTFTDYEVIVVNDGSPDTPQLEIVLKPYFDRITYLKAENQGPSGARNTGIRHAQGTFLAFLDSDDMWFPEFLDEQMRSFREDPSLDLSYSDGFLFRNTAFAGTLVTRLRRSDCPINFKTLVTSECFVVMSSTVVRKQVVIEAGLFDERLRRCEDYELWLRIVFRGGKIKRRQRALGLRRRHSASLSANEETMYDARIGVLKKLPETLELPIQARMLLDESIRRAEADLELLKVDRYLLAGTTELAETSLGRAQEFFHSRKLHLALSALKAVPWLVGPSVKIWRLFLEGINYLLAAKEGRIYWTWKRRELYNIPFRGRG